MPSVSEAVAVLPAGGGIPGGNSDLKAIAPAWQRLLEEVILPSRTGSSWNAYYGDVAVFLQEHWRLPAAGRVNDIDNTTASRGRDGDGALKEPLTTTNIGERQHTHVFVEIGTAFGGLANFLLQSFPSSMEVVAVDPFLPNYDVGDLQSQMLADIMDQLLQLGILNSDITDDQQQYQHADQSNGLGEVRAREQFSRAWGEALSFDLHRRHGCRYHGLRKLSVDAAASYQGFLGPSSTALDNGLVDAVFIDGLHTYEGVKEDIGVWVPKLRKPGGLLIFNDYGNVEFPGVTRAADEFFEAHPEMELIIGAEGKPPGLGNAAVLF